MHQVTGVDRAAGTGDCSECGRVRVRIRFRGATSWAECRRPRTSRAAKTRQDRRRGLRRAGALFTEAELQRVLAVDRCEACGRTDDLAVDHDHATGRLRGRLCRPCNSALGLLRDDVRTLQALVGYLERSRSGSS